MTPFITISELVDEYLILRQVSGKKYYSSFLLSAQEVWRDCFQKTLMVCSSRWQPLIEGRPGMPSYIEKINCAVRIFSFNTVDDCGNIVPIYYNQQRNTVPEPKVKSNKKCGCSNDVCDTVDNLIFSTQKLFSIGNRDYYEKKWVKYCNDGCLVEYTETPVKKFNDRKGDGGDFNDDYNDDYLKGKGGLSNYEIVVITDEKVLCELEMESCGCPKNTIENEEKLKCNCSCYTPKCYSNDVNINDNEFGEIKVSECGTKYYFWPGKKGKEIKNINVVYQTSGDSPDSETVIPIYAKATMFTGIDYYSSRFVPSISRFEKQEKRAAWRAESDDLILYLNPIRISELVKIQNQPKIW